MEMDNTYWNNPTWSWCTKPVKQNHINGEELIINGVKATKDICKKIKYFTFQEGLWEFYDDKNNLIAAASGNILIR